MQNHYDVCGRIEQGNRDEKKHLFTCRACGYRSSDERIGAMNLYRMWINYLTDKQVSDTVTLEHISFAKGAVNHPSMQHHCRIVRQAKGRSFTSVCTTG